MCRILRMLQSSSTQQLLKKINLYSSRFVVDAMLNLPLTLCNSLLRVRYVVCLRFLQELGRHNYVTATSYLELIASFRQLLTKRRQAVMEAKQQYVNGLDKLAFAESQVNLMSCSKW